MISAVRPRRGGVKVSTAVTLFVLGGTLAAALPLQWIWWRTARSSSLEIVDTLSDQIVSTVRREWWERVVATEAAHQVAASLLGPDPDHEAVRRSLTTALIASSVPSSASYADAGASLIVAARDASGVIVMKTAPSAGRAEPAAAPGWRETGGDPAYNRPAVSFAGSTEAGGVLSVFIGLDRFAALLGDIPVGRTGAAFIVDPRGAIKVRPARGAIDALSPVVQAASGIVAARPAQAVNVVETRRLDVGGAVYRAAFSPLEFNGWQFVVVIPEAEFLGGIERTMTRTLLGLLALALALGAGAAVLAQRVLTRPVDLLTVDLGRIERFELEDIAYHPASLTEFDKLSAAIARMASGLADFAKFIPTELVRTLLADGVRMAPGGETREMTLLFADVAGFTKISERMGTAVIDVISQYLDVASRAVESNGGAVDKFIGDAVMALWGAPRPDPNQALNACAAALALLEAVRAAGIVDDQGVPLGVRVGVHSGPAVVGNIGSARRLNYTAIGDTVNLASRLESANKVFGTAILISEETRRRAGATLATRELADLAVSGKEESVRVHELLGLAGGGETPPWIAAYAAALAAYRTRDFIRAAALLDDALAARPDDGPSIWLKSVVRKLQQTPPPPEWSGAIVLDSK